MHFLCLHGLGTNTQILELQTAPLRHLLPPSVSGSGYHTYDFIEGSHPHAPDPALVPFASPTDTFHAYFLPSQPSTIIDALRDLRDLLEEEEFDGIIGFSQGSCLLATLLLSPLSPLRDPESRCAIKMAVFLSPGMALDYEALERGEYRMFDGKARAERIEGLVTAHVYGKNDQVAEGQGELLWDLCRGVKERSVHGQGHAVPGKGLHLDDAVRCLERAIEKAEGGFGF